MRYLLFVKLNALSALHCAKCITRIALRIMRYARLILFNTFCALRKKIICDCNAIVANEKRCNNALRRVVTHFNFKLCALRVSLFVDNFVAQYLLLAFYNA